MAIAKPVGSLLDYFDGIYILNLVDRPERLQDTLTQLKALDPARAGRAIVFAGTRSEQAYGFPSLGAYGCFHGHLGILRDARDRGFQSVLVLEDDVRFEAAAKNDWREIAVALQSTQWALANLGFDAKHVRELEGGPVHSESPIVRVDVPLMQTHCYAVHGEVLPLLLEYMETLLSRQPGDPKGGPMHYDGALYHFCKDHPWLTRVRPKTSLAGQRSSRSDVAGDRWFDTDLPILREMTLFLRSLKDKIRALTKR